MLVHSVTGSSVCNIHVALPQDENAKSFSCFRANTGIAPLRRSLKHLSARTQYITSFGSVIKVIVLLQVNTKGVPCPLESSYTRYITHHPSTSRRRAIDDRTQNIESKNKCTAVRYPECSGRLGAIKRPPHVYIGLYRNPFPTIRLCGRQMFIYTDKR